MSRLGGWEADRSLRTSCSLPLEIKSSQSHLLNAPVDTSNLWTQGLPWPYTRQVALQRPGYHTQWYSLRVGI